MGLQHQVIYLLMLCIHCGLTQNVTDLPTSQTIRKSDTLLSGFYNTSGNSSSSNDTSNEAYSGLSSGNSITLHDFSVSHVNVTTSKENSSTIQQDLQMLSDVFTSEANSTENMQKDMVDEKLNVTSSIGETNYINTITAIKMNSIPNAVSSIHENVSQMQITTSTFNDFNNSWEEDRGTDMFLQAPNNEVKETSIPNNISVFTSNETVFDVPSVPFVTYNESAAERLIPTPDNSVQKQQDISNITENRNAPVDINITVANSTSDNNYELPEIKWRPGMRQPQTISDLIRVAGADIRFIATQFGSNFSVNSTEAHPLNANDTKTIPEQVKIIGSINDAITKLQDRHGLELGHESSSSPMQNDGFINDNNFETPQLSNVKVSGPIVLPSRQISIDGDSSNSDTNNLRTMKSDDAPSKLTQVADGFMATNTLDNIIPNVVVRNSDDADSSRISYVPIIESRTANFPDLSTDEFGQNSDISGPSGGNGWINPTGQSETDPRRLISFGNNPEYVIGTGNSVQIPQSLIINHIPNGDTLEREGNRRNGNALFLRINRGSTEMEMIPGTTSSTVIRPALLTDTSRFETSRETDRSGNFRSDGPRRVDLPGGSSSRNQESVGRVSMFDSSIGFTPRRDEFRSSTNGLSFVTSPTGRSFSNSAPVRNGNMGILSPAFDNMIPRQTRQNFGTVQRNVGLVEFPRRRNFDESIGGTNVMPSRGSIMARNTDVVSGFIRPRMFADSAIPRTNSFERGSFVRDGSAIAFGNDMLGSRPEIMPPFTDFSGFGIPIYPLGSRTFSAPIFPSGTFSRTMFMPAEIFPPFPPRTPFPFL